MCASYKELRQKIETLRNEMIRSGRKYGLNHPITIKTSKKLDVLLNIQMKKTQDE